jgi:hypothetical protein
MTKRIINMLDLYFTLLGLERMDDIQRDKPTTIVFRGGGEFTYKTKSQVTAHRERVERDLIGIANLNNACGVKTVF